MHTGKGPISPPTLQCKTSPAAKAARAAVLHHIYGPWTEDGKYYPSIRQTERVHIVIRCLFFVYTYIFSNIIYKNFTGRVRSPHGIGLRKINILIPFKKIEV